MPDAPGRPFREWSPADRLAWLAEDMLEREDDLVAQAWGADLADLVTELATATDKVEPVALCRNSHRGREAPCDRPTGHDGGHSWAAPRAVRLAREYESMALVDLPATRRKLIAAAATVRQQGKALAAWEAKPVYRRRPKPDRG